MSGWFASALKNHDDSTRSGAGAENAKKPSSITPGSQSFKGRLQESVASTHTPPNSCSSMMRTMSDNAAAVIDCRSRSMKLARSTYRWTVVASRQRNSQSGLLRSQLRKQLSTSGGAFARP